MAGQLGEVEDVDETRIQVSVNKAVQNVHETTDYSPYGIDSLPEKGAKVALFNLGNIAHRIMMGVRRKPTDKKSKPGETRLYSKTGAQIFLDKDDNIIIQTASGALLKMNLDGNIEINGNTKNAMTFQDFETVWNAFIAAYLVHTHLDPVSGSTGVPQPPLTTGEKDMTPAKNTKVKM